MKIYLQKTSGEKSCVDQIENGNPPFDDVFKALTRTSVRAKMLDDLNITTKVKDRTVRHVHYLFLERTLHPWRIDDAILALRDI